MADVIGLGLAEGIDGGEVFLPLGMVVMTGEDAAGADFFPPLAQGLAAFVALMGVAVDVDEVERSVAEQGERLLETGAQDDGAGTLFGQAPGGGIALDDVVPPVAGPGIDGIEAADGCVAQEMLRVGPSGDPKLDPEPGEAVMGEQGGQIVAGGDGHGGGASWQRGYRES